MKIPPPPPPPTIPPPPLFPQARKMRMEKQLGDDIRNLCNRLAKATIVPGWQDTFWRFRDAVNSNGTLDTTRLPVISSGPNSLERSAIACLYARLSWMIQRNWKLCVHGTENEAHIRQYMGDIERLLNGGKLDDTLRRCEVMGDERTNYWLHVPGEKS